MAANKDKDKDLTADKAKGHVKDQAAAKGADKTTAAAADEPAAKSSGRQKGQDNLRLLHHVPPYERGVVVPADLVADPDRLVELEAAAWTGEPVTVQTAPPGAFAAGAGAGAVAPLTTGQDAEEVAEAAVRIKHLVEDNERLKAEVKELTEKVRAKDAERAEDEGADLATARRHAEEVAHEKMRLEGENERLNKELQEVRAGIGDHQEQVKRLEKELAEAKKKHK